MPHRKQDCTQYYSLVHGVRKQFARSVQAEILSAVDAIGLVIIYDEW